MKGPYRNRLSGAGAGHPCHLCGQDLLESFIVGTTARHDDHVVTVACGQCGLTQTTPLPSEADLAAYYAGPYREQFTRALVNGHEWGTPEAERLMDEAAAQYAAEIVARLDLGGARVVEIGSGDGRLTRELDKLARCAMGVEPDVAVAVESRAPVTSMVPLADFAEQTAGMFDAVVCVHVLEHFREPLTALAQMRMLLEPGGKVWLEVPNLAQPYGCVDSHYWQRPHLYHFTAHTLMLLMLRAGFEDVHIADGGHVMYAHATSGSLAPMTYEDAAAAFVAMTGSPIPTGCDIDAHLDDYRASYTRKRRANDATAALKAFRAGEDVDAVALRDAVELLGTQSAVAARIAERAVQEGAAMLGELEAQIDVADQWSADPWLMGYRAGEAAMAARASHMLGHAVNGWKLIEVEGTR